MKLRVNIHRRCVYVHYVASEKRPVYVGKGRAYRPFLFNLRRENWKKYVARNGGEYTVKILRWFDSDSEAIAFETRMIKKLRPLCNIKLNGKKRSRRSRQRTSLSLRGLKKSKRHLRNLGLANTGRVVSEETREKLRKSTTAWRKRCPGFNPRTMRLKPRELLTLGD